MRLYFNELTPYIGDLLDGLKYSIILTVVSMTIGLLIGMLACICKMGKYKGIKRIAEIYIEAIRNTPLLVQLYILYFGLAQFGIDFSPFTASCIAMIINAGAYNAEILRGGFGAVPSGLTEAGMALGMSGTQIFRYITLKLALKSAFPGLLNQLILLFLFSSVTSTIAMPELTYVTFNLQSSTARVFEVLIMSGALYYGISAIWVMIFRSVQKKLFNWS